MSVSIGKNSLARAAAANGSRAAAETAKNPATLREVACQAILPLKGRKWADAAPELIASVKKHGVIQPVLLAQTGPDELRVLDGAARVSAALAAELKTVPAVILELTAAEATALRKELVKFAASAAPSPVTATEVTAVGQAMPDWLL